MARIQRLIFHEVNLLWENQFMIAVPGQLSEPSILIFWSSYQLRFPVLWCFIGTWASLWERKDFSCSTPYLSLFLSSACHLIAHGVPAPLPSHSCVIQTHIINVKTKQKKKLLPKNPTFCISKYLSHGFRRKILIVLFLVISFCISRLHFKNMFTVDAHNSRKIRTDRTKSKRGPKRWSKGRRNCPLRKDSRH